MEFILSIAVNISLLDISYLFLCFFKKNIDILFRMHATTGGTSKSSFPLNATGQSSIQVQKPYVGMKFKTSEEAGVYYEEYECQNGFWIRVRTINMSRPRINEVTFIKFVCSHERQYYNKKIVEKTSEMGKDEKEVKATQLSEVDVKLI